MEKEKLEPELTAENVENKEPEPTAENLAINKEPETITLTQADLNAAIQKAIDNVVLNQDKTIGENDNERKDVRDTINETLIDVEI